MSFIGLGFFFFFVFFLRGGVCGYFYLFFAMSWDTESWFYMSLAVEARSLKLWTTWEVPILYFSAPSFAKAIHG